MVVNPLSFDAESTKLSFVTVKNFISKVTKFFTGTRDCYCEISKEPSSLYFGLHVICQFEARVREFDMMYVSIFSAVTILGGGGVGCLSNS
jgi:hypothetical protein